MILTVNSEHKQDMVFLRVNRSPGFSPFKIAVHESKFATVFYGEPAPPNGHAFAFYDATTFLWHFSTTNTAGIASLEDDPAAMHCRLARSICQFSQQPTNK